MSELSTNHELLEWLLDADVSIQYQVYRDLLGQEKPHLQNRIEKEGFAKRFLEARKPEGHWGDRFYQPKWISSHYTLLDLKHLAISPDQSEIRESIEYILATQKGADGGVLCNLINPSSDMCVNGMFLNYASYFKMPEPDLRSIVDLILDEHMGDGAWNCRSNRSGATHSSMHTTISVLEGIQEYVNNGYQYRVEELKKTELTAREFLLLHKLFRSHRTGEVIEKRMTMLSYPSRWFYNILRALDYFQVSGTDYDPRMQDAIDILMKKRRKDDTWPVQAKHAGQVHFDMEKTGGPSRWNTLRALRVLEKYGSLFK